MANCHNLFTDFTGVIKLNESKRKSLKKSRKSLRDKIRKYFKEEKPDEIQPKFTGQGSFVTDTILEPIPIKKEEDGEEIIILKYDVDDGIYFIGDKDERKSTQTYHNWIKNAVDGHTQTPPVDKPTCIRVLFADGHNIDLPIYFKCEDEVPELANTSKDWMESDPKAFKKWFEQKTDGKPQLVRLVRYIKAWCDFREDRRKDKKMPSGFIMTILACNHYYSHDRDDIALKETLVNIQAKLEDKFECFRPTVPTDEDLLADYNHKDYFMECLQNFIDDAKSALKSTNQKEACGKWQKHFGDRFPCQNAKEEEEKNSTPAFIVSEASQSRPWSRNNPK